MPIETQVLVIGAGPGGYVAALKLAKLGQKTLLVEKDRLGGVCLNVGCIPSKGLIHSAGILHKARKTPGLEAPDLRLNLSKAQDWKNAMVAGLSRGIAALAKGNNVEVLSGTARLTGPHEAEVTTSTGTEKVTFEKALLATGSRPIAIPGFDFDGTHVLSSTDVLDLREIPGRLLVIGGGAIGLELGTLFAKLGCQITVVEFLPQILSGLEPDLVAPVQRGLQRLGVEILTSAKARSFKTSPNGLLVSVETPAGDKVFETDKILLSVGRSPNTKDLGLESVDIACDSKSHILVNEAFQTKVDSIYAIGDVIGPPYLAHKASHEGLLAAARIAEKKAGTRGNIPAVVFTDPEIAAVGESEAAARSRGAEIVTGKFPFAALGKAQAIRETEGFVKLVADKNTHKILGGAIVGPGASDMIGEICLALKLGATLEDLGSTVHPHPTLSEALGEAAEAALGQAIHILQR